MKTFASGLTAHYAGGTTRLATALKLTRKRRTAAGLVDDGVYGFTTHNVDAVIDGVTYQSDPGLAVLDIVIAADAAVGNLELMTLHDGTLFSTADVMNGRWRSGEFLIFRYNVDSPSTMGIDKLLAGTLGETKIMDNNVVQELLDLRQYLQQDVGDASSENCRRRLGSSGMYGGNCRVRLDPPEWEALTPYTQRLEGDAATGSVVKPSALNNRQFKCTTAGTSDVTEPTWNTTIGGTTADGSVVWTTIQALTVTGTLTHVTSNQVFRDSSRTEAADFFGEGQFTFDSGDNAGMSCKVKEYAADGTFTLAIPLYGEVAVDDTYTAEVGCRKRHELDCWDKFDNGLNFVAEPHRRGINNVTQSPSSDVSGL